MGPIAFEAELQPRRPAVNGYTWRGSDARMRGEFLLGTSREVRTAAGVEAGAAVAVELALDGDERTVEAPPALAAALAGDHIPQAGFDGLACGHRKEYGRWIAEAKGKTRERRVAKALAQLREGKPLR